LYGDGDRTQRAQRKHDDAQVSRRSRRLTIEEDRIVKAFVRGAIGECVESVCTVVTSCMSCVHDPLG
jgi:hypothetical protein